MHFTFKTFVSATASALILLIKFASTDAAQANDTAIGTTEQLQLQHAFGNWQVCTETDEFTPLEGLVPDNVVFLSSPDGYEVDEDEPPGCVVKQYNGTIAAGNQTLFFPLFNFCWFDWKDDWMSRTGQCAINSTTVEENEALTWDAVTADLALDAGQSNASFYAKIDGEDIGFFFLYDPSPFFLQNCPNGELCDDTPCDLNPTECGGVDLYPCYGNWAMDKREWVAGESHVIEFGGNYFWHEYTGSSYYICLASEYTLTAAPAGGGAPTRAPVVAVPTGTAPVAALVAAPTPTTTSGVKSRHSGILAWLAVFILLGLTASGI